MTHILGVSSPRAGHHLFEAILRGVVGQNYKYCETYSLNECCKNVPCNAQESQKWIAEGVFFQKSHDFYFADPLFVKGTFRLIQLRDPIPRAFSDYSLYLKNSKLPDNENTFRTLLEYEAAYFIQFYRKWVLLRTTPAFVLHYERLVDEPVIVMKEFLNFCGLEVDRATIQETVRRVMGTVVDTPVSYVPRDVYSHKHANSQYCSQYEAVVFKYCVDYPGKRFFSTSTPTSESDMTPFEHAVLAYCTLNQGGKERETLKHAQTARDAHPDDFELNKLVRNAQIIWDRLQLHSANSQDQVS